MDKNLITITIDNYKGKKIIFTVSSDATVDIWKIKSVSGKDKGKIIDVKVCIADDEIKIKEEDYNG